LKNKLLIGASAVAVMLSMSDQAFASSECGIPSTSGNPYVVSCISDPNHYQNGISYNDSTYATPTGLKVDIYGTAIVAPINNATAVSVTGTSNNDAIIYVRNGARISSGGNGLVTATSGSGTAQIDNHASVTSGGIALSASGGSTGSSDVRNESDGAIVVANGVGGLVANGGSAFVANYGSLTATNTLSGSQTLYGLAATSTGVGSIMSVLNASTVSLSADLLAVTGIASLGSTGQVNLTNWGTLTVNAKANAATGFYVAASGTPGATTLTNTGALSVTGGTSAAGFDVRQGTSAALSSQQLAASGGITVAGGSSASGFAVSNVSGAESVTLSGGLLQVSTTADNSAATGISLSGGTSQSVEIAPNTVGSTVYKADVTVTAGGAGSSAKGIALSGGTTNATVDLSNASLTVSSTGGSASGITVANGGGDVNVLTGAPTSSAAIAVSAGGGSALGIGISGTSASQTVLLGDALTVNGSNGATGLSAAGASGAISVTAAKDVTVNGHAGQTQGLSLSDGSSQTLTLNGNLLVSGATGTTGIAEQGSSGAVAVTLAKGLTVTDSSGSAVGIAQGGGSTENVTLNGALSVSGAGGSAFGITQAGGSGAVSDTLNASFAVSNANGNATGIAITGGDGATVAINQSFGVTANAGQATGVAISGAGANTVTLAKAITVQATGGDARGLDLSNGSATVHLNTPLTVSSDTGTVYGLADNAGSSLTVDGAAAITASSAGNVYGVATSNMTGTQALTLGTVNATSTGGRAYGVLLEGSGAISLTDAATITAKGKNGGAGVWAALNNAATPQALQVNVATVNATGDGVEGILATNDTGNATVTATTVTTTGNSTYAIGVGSYGALASVTAGTITTSGSNSYGVIVEDISSGGLASLNANTITTSGTNAIGAYVIGFGTGTGANVTLGSVTTTGASSIGVLGMTQSGALNIATTNVAVSGNGSVGVSANSNSGAIAINAVRTSAASGDAIHATSTSGAVTVNLADGGTTTGGAAGVSVSTGGTAAINLGNSAHNAVLYGATAGLISAATGGQVVNLTGTVGAGNGLAVSLSGGASTINNSGTINGYVALTGSSNTLNNSSVWNAYAGDSTFSGTSVVNNSGTINVFPLATLTSSTGAILRLAGLTTLNNSGTLNLVNGRTGDALSVSGAVVGSGSSRLVIDANLGAVALTGAAVGTADQLVAGSVSGRTALVINDLGAATSGTFNFSGIRVVTSSAIAAGSVVLQGGPITKGFATYSLMSDTAGNLDLVGLPSTAAFEMIRTVSETQKYWRRSSDVWGEQLRGLAMTRGSRMWGQVYGGSQTDQARPVYGATVLNQAVSFTPNLDIQNSWGGVQLGYELGRAGFAVGVTGGYGQQTGKLKVSRDEIKISGGNLGAYARVKLAEGAYANLLAKVDRYQVTYTLSGGAVAPGFYGTTYGLDFRSGYHHRIGKAFIEPQVGLSWTHSDLDGFTTPLGDLGAAFHHTESVYGSIGLRAGLETKSGAWAVKPYVGVAYEGEFNDMAHVRLTSGGTSLDFADISEGGRARLEAGVQAHSGKLSAFAKVDGVAGNKANGVGGSVGLALRW